MTAPLELDGPTAPPRCNGELVFDNPWESRAFGIVMSLYEVHLFTWPQFRGALIARLRRWQAEADEGSSFTYYEHWLRRPHRLTGRRRCSRRGGHRRACGCPGSSSGRSRPPALSHPGKEGRASTSAPVVVTGAAGRIGGSGRHVVAELRRRGMPVRAMVRRIDDRSDALSDSWADIVLADFTDYASLLNALDGARAACFCYPVGPALTEAVGLFAAAGRETGLRRIVDLSLDAAFAESPSPQGRAAWVAERIFEWAGFEGTHLRVAAFFMENLVTLYGRHVREHGCLRNSFGDLAPSWIAATDVGAIAAAALANPASATARTTVVGGTEAADHAFIAHLLTAVTGRAVTYEAITPDRWRDELLARDRASGAGNPTVAAHQTAQSVQLRRHHTHLVTDDVERLTGRRPVTLEDFLAVNRESFVPHP